MSVISFLLIFSFIFTYVVSVGYFSNDILTIVLFLSSFILYYKSYPNARQNIQFASLILLLTLNYIFTDSGIGGLLNILTIFLFISSVNNSYWITERIIRYLSIVSLFCLIHFYSIYVSIDTVNTNTLGLISYYLILSIMPLFIVCRTLSGFRRFISFSILIICSILAILIILFSGCRSALWGFMASIVMFLLITFKLLSNKLLNILTFCLVFGGGAYAALNAYLFNNNIEASFLSFLRSEEKDYVFSGREAIWAELLELFYKSPIIGSGNHLTLMSFESVACHNSVLAITCLYGLPISLIIYISIWKITQRILPITHNVLIRIFFCSFCSNMIVGFYESTIVDDFRFMTILPLLMAIQLVNKEKHENSNPLHLHRQIQPLL